MNKVNRILFSVGLSGIVTFIISMYIYRNLDNITFDFNIIQTLKQNDILIIFYSGIMILVSLFALVIAIFYTGISNREGKKRLWLKTFSFYVIVVLEGLQITLVLVKSEISLWFIFVTWIMIAYIVWLLFDGLKLIYRWIKKDGETDVVKLSFIWAIIAFIVGIII